MMMMVMAMMTMIIFVPRTYLKIPKQKEPKQNTKDDSMTARLRKSALFARMQ